MKVQFDKKKVMFQMYYIFALVT